MSALAERVSVALEREPLASISTAALRELDSALAGAQELEDLPGKWQAAILRAESGAAEPSPGGCCHGSGASRPGGGRFARVMTDVQEVAIRGDMIRLGQLLKLAGVVGGGGDAKALLADGDVRVNGEPESRRGRQLHAGDLVTVGDAVLRVGSG